MKLSYETSFEDFAYNKCWGGAKDTIDELTSDEIDSLAPIIEDMVACDADFDCDEGSLNDFLWFERDLIAEWLGYKNFEDLVKKHNSDEDEEESEDSEDEI